MRATKIHAGKTHKKAPKLSVSIEEVLVLDPAPRDARIVARLEGGRQYNNTLYEEAAGPPQDQDGDYETIDSRVNSSPTA